VKVFRSEQNQSIHHEGHREHGVLILIFFVFSATAPALLNHRDVANAENAGAVFCLPPASMQSFVFSVVNNFFQPDLNNIFTVSHLDRLIIPKRDKFILPASFAGDTLRYKAYLAAGKIYALAPISALSIHIKLFQAIT
jgi:hypothetical protein